MTPAKPARRKNAGRIRDERGRSFTQLDPIALTLLRQHDVIEADALREIAQEPGIRLKPIERIAFFTQIACAVVLVVFLSYRTISSGIAAAFTAEHVILLYGFMLPWISWFGMRKKRFGKIKSAMLKHRRCPHCGYDLRGLGIEATDSATICPECGGAWKLPEALGAETANADLSHDHDSPTT